MGTRRVQNFYIPKDFDPKLLGYEPNLPFQKVEVRMMLPFSLRCNTCGEYMYQGTKFSTKKEKVKGCDPELEEHRFFLRCFGCHAIITIRTDPKNMDYLIESGATRNFQLWKDGEQQDTTTADGSVAGGKESEGTGGEDAMSSLERRTLQSRMEMEVLDGLDAIRSRNAIAEGLDIAEVIRRRREAEEQEELGGGTGVHQDGGIDIGVTQEEKEQEDAILSSIQFGHHQKRQQKRQGEGGVLGSSSEDEQEEEEDDEDEVERSQNQENSSSSSSSSSSYLDPLSFLLVEEDDGEKKKKKKKKHKKHKKEKKHKRNKRKEEEDED